MEEGRDKSHPFADTKIDSNQLQALVGASHGKGQTVWMALGRCAIAPSGTRLSHEKPQYLLQIDKCDFAP